MADPRGDDGIGELRKLVTSLAQTVGHLDASYKSVQQTLDEIRSDLRDLRAGGVNWLGILGLVVSIVIPVGGGLGVFVMMTREPLDTRIALHEKRLDRFDEHTMARAERLARLEAFADRQEAINSHYWRGIDRDAQNAIDDRAEAWSKTMDDLGFRLNRLELGMGDLRAALGQGGRPPAGRGQGDMK
ncbi:MAG: hypothetical protein KC616_25610 [Myxococcales bacterium]|nr:hypothetical protein [Myxococcales bacterium]